MKRMMIVCWMLVLGMGSNLIAQETATHQLSSPSFRVKSLDATQPGWVEVLFQNDQSTRANVNVYDQAGVLLNTQYTHGKDLFAKRYNLSNLPEGAYTFEVRTRDTTLRETIAFLGEKNQAQVAIQKSTDPKKYTLVMDKPDVSPLYVKIFDRKGGDLLYSDALNQKGVYRQVFNLEEVWASSVTFVVSDDQGTVSTISTHPQPLPGGDFASQWL